MLHGRAAQIFKKCRRHLKILNTSKVKASKCLADFPQILGVTIKQFDRQGELLP
jgi:hypothetical protein